jgi:hypothetical protein
LSAGKEVNRPEENSGGDMTWRVMEFSGKNNAKKRYFLAILRPNFQKKGAFGRGIPVNLLGFYGYFRRE